MEPTVAQSRAEQSDLATTTKPTASSGSSHPEPPTSARHSNPESNNLYQCAACSCRYARPEHLARHVRTHLNSRRYVCETCGKAFARVDVYKRHADGHARVAVAASPEYQSQSQSQSRQAPALGPRAKRQKTNPRSSRVSRACSACAVARVKCEERKPCSRCCEKGLVCGTPEPRTSTWLSSESTRGLDAPSMARDARQPVVRATSPLSPGSGSGPASTDRLERRVSQQGSFVVAGPTQGRGDRGFTETEIGGDLHEGFDRQPVIEPPVEDLHFSDFMRDVMTWQPGDPQGIAESNNTQMLDLFWDELSTGDMDLHLASLCIPLDLSVFEATPLVSSSQHMVEGAVQTDVSSIHRRMTEIWNDSPWHWKPSELENSTYEQVHLPLSPEDSASSQLQQVGQRVQRVIRERLDENSRDKIMAMILSTCRSASVMTRVAASFPSARLMDNLLHLFVASLGRLDPIALHYGTLCLNELPIPLLACMVAAGALLTPFDALHKFGFAVQEAMRPALVNIWDEDNTMTRNVLLIQAFNLYLDMGLWSCSRRKRELAYAHSQPSITMLRESNRFKKSAYQHIYPLPEDEGEQLEHKWKRWAASEACKRLAWRVFMQESQKSMGTGLMPIISYSEMSLDLPCPHRVWIAPDAASWKAESLRALQAPLFDQLRQRPVILRDALCDIAAITTGAAHIDLELCAFIYLHAVWGMIYDHRKVQDVFRPRSPPSNAASINGPANMALPSRHQELRYMLVQFEHAMENWGPLTCRHQIMMVLHLLFLNLHVSLDDIQLFVGREGEEPARRIYPDLQSWVDTRDARAAVWHSGQILRAAKLFPPRQLKDLFATVVYQACLVLWTYGVIMRAKARGQPEEVRIPKETPDEPVFLDEEESIESQRFIAVNRGSAMLTGPGQDPSSRTVARLEDSNGIMEIGHQILQMDNVSEKESRPAIVNSLCYLIKQLGSAANVVQTG